MHKVCMPHRIPRAWEQQFTKKIVIDSIVDGMQGTRSYATHTGFLAHGNSKGDTRGRSKPQNSIKRAVRNLEERNVVTKGKSNKEGLTSAEVLTNLTPHLWIVGA